MEYCNEVGRALRVLTHLERMQPVGRRFWYLGVLGVEPDRQGSGVGSALLTSGLCNCDQNKVGTYLETAEPPICRSMRNSDLTCCPPRNYEKDLLCGPCGVSRQSESCMTRIFCN